MSRGRQGIGDCVMGAIRNQQELNPGTAGSRMGQKDFPFLLLTN